MANFVTWEFFYLQSISNIILALLFLFIFSCITQRIASKGPTIWPYFGIIPSILLHFHEIHDWTTNALVESGGSFYYKGSWLFGFKGLITADPAKVEYILKTKFINFSKGKYYKERFQELLGNGIFNSDDDEWKEQRKITMIEMFSSSFMSYSLEKMQDLVHKKLLKVIENFHDNEVVDMQDLLLRFTFDNICMVGFGVDFSCLAPEISKNTFAEAFEDATECCLFRFLMPPFVWKVMRYFNFGQEKKLKEAVRVVHEFVLAIIKNRKFEVGKLCNKGHHQSQDDLLSRLIMKTIKGDLAYSDNFLKDLCISFILAGRDTSSVALVWFFWLVNKNPEVENKIVNEIVKIARERDKEELLDIIFNIEELERMVYLQATIAETLRLYPPVPINFKEVKEDELFKDGMKVHKGSRVFYHLYAMGRMETIWGKDCKEFKPERWIKDAKFVKENQFKYVVFNAGPRFCVGKKFAYLQMKMVAASILMRYKVNIVKNQVIAPKVTTTLYTKHGLLVNFQPRIIAT